MCSVESTHSSKRSNLKKAFTLIELLIVVAIIGILAGVGVPMYNGYMAQAKYNSIQTNFVNVSKVVEIEVFNCELKGSVTLLVNGGGTRKKNCKSENTNSFANLFIDHFHFSGFKNPISGDSATWCYGACKANKESGYIFFNGNPTNKCLVNITSNAINPETNKVETFSKSISMRGLVSQC